MLDFTYYDKYTERMAKKKARMGRPPKPKGQVKTEFLHIRLTKDELRRLQAKAKESDSTVGTWARELLLREALSAFAAGDSYPEAYAAVAQQDFAAQLRSLELPVLVFAGTEDILFGQLEASYACLKHGTVREIQAAGSYVCDRHPARVAALLREFFRENSYGPTTQ